MNYNEEIQTFLSRVDKDKHSGMLVVCDTFSYENYPVYVKKGDDVIEKAVEFGNNNDMQRVVDIFNFEESASCAQ